MGNFKTINPPVSYTAWLFRVRSPLLAESRLISFPLATEMFQFARYFSFWFTKGGGHRSQGDTRLPVSFRYVKRPVSILPRHPPGVFDFLYVLILKKFQIKKNSAEKVERRRMK